MKRYLNVTNKSIKWNFYQGNAMTIKNIKPGIELKAYFGTSGLFVETFIDGEHVATNSFGVMALAQDFIEKRACPFSNLIDDDEGANESYALIDSLKDAMDFINDSVDDEDYDYDGMMLEAA